MLVGQVQHADEAEVHCGRGGAGWVEADWVGACVDVLGGQARLFSTLLCLHGCPAAVDCEPKHNTAAQPLHSHHSQQAMPPKSAATRPLTRKVLQPARRVALRHGAQHVLQAAGMRCLHGESQAAA